MSEDCFRCYASLDDFSDNVLCDKCYTEEIKISTQVIKEKIKLKKALDVAVEAIDEVVKYQKQRVFDHHSDELEEAKEQIKEILESE